WHHDVALDLPVGGAVDARGLGELVGDRLHAGQHQDDGEADVLPREDAHQRPDRDVRVSKPVGGEEAEADVVQRVVDRAVDLEHQAEAGAGDDLGDHVGDGDQDTDEASAANG